MELNKEEITMLIDLFPFVINDFYKPLYSKVYAEFKKYKDNEEPNNENNL